MVGLAGGGLPPPHGHPEGADHEFGPIGGLLNAVAIDSGKAKWCFSGLSYPHQSSFRADPSVFVGF